MARVALTLWFTITTLLGPGVCCCSFANASHPATANGQTTPATKPAKSCCHQEVPPCGENGKPTPEPGKPSKCPCEHNKPVKSLVATGSTATDLAAQLKLLDVLCAWLLASFTFESPAVVSTPIDSSPPVARLAGSDLLAAYSRSAAEPFFGRPAGVLPAFLTSDLSRRTHACILNFLGSARRSTLVPAPLRS